ncbi:MAG: hypothetical protein IVW57_04435 [Ktedonobacterales bacterium]|nr:hypothetical protein [Ktedonobacterales bacterium]
MPIDDEHDGHELPAFGPRMRLERDEHGRVRAVPDEGAPYLPTRPMSDTGTSDTGTSDTTAPAGTGRGWVAWRVTDPEPGDAPAWESLNHTEQRYWGAKTPDERAQLGALWPRLAAWVAQEFPGCHLLRTPGATGIVLLSHALPWPKTKKGEPPQRPYQYPLLEDGLARLFAAHDTPHRMEVCAEPGRLVRRITAYDARIAWGAYMRSVPIIRGDLVHDAGPYVPYRNGKYRALVTVPQGWAHIGLAPRKAPHGSGWEYPRTPGEEWECWLDEVDMRLLTHEDARMRNGLPAWPVRVLERVLFAPSDTPGGDPLREWAERLGGAVERFDAAPHTPANRALRRALRAMIAHPVGLWHKQSNARSVSAESLDEMDWDATADLRERQRVDEDDGRVSIRGRVDLSEWQKHWRRPEWSTAIFARERVQVARRALTLPAHAVLGILGDAVYLANDCQPNWPDNGKIGCYRAKDTATFDHDTPVPAAPLSLSRLAKGA